MSIVLVGGCRLGTWCALHCSWVCLVGGLLSKGSGSETGNKQWNQDQESVLLIHNPGLPPQLHVKSAQQDERGWVWMGHFRSRIFLSFSTRKTLANKRDRRKPMLSVGVYTVRNSLRRPLFTLYLFYLYGRFVCMDVYALCVQCPQSTEESLGWPGTGVTDNYELSWGCWESSPNPLVEQPVLLTIEPSFHLTRKYVFF